ncbi:SANT [Musa troglodytarum]|uniref:SANT n=1 Tax=Musa troglodytarum TaxID=320322 RepID=A0A9E7J9A5_9LILI|nr:SANT [Musa troglodytarum]
MDYIEEEARPRFLFSSSSGASSAAAPAETRKVSKFHAAACLSAAAALLLLAYLSLSDSQTLSSLLLWAALSLALGPFAPLSATGGDARVGHGDPLPDAEPAPSHLDLDEPKRRVQGRRTRSQKIDGPPPPAATISKPTTAERNKDLIFVDGVASANDNKGKEQEEEKEWTDEDLELLKKQVSKHPVGEPRRWERIAEAFQGRHGLDSVIDTAKSLSERRPAAGDPYQQFLKQRKPVDKRAAAVEVESHPQDGSLMEHGDPKKDNGEGNGNWSSGEDIALLNALKAFPKDASMRWEKIAAAVPGRSKAACMKRVAELKKSFRSSKSTEA